MDNEQNKSEKPTPYKLKQAREKGQVSKSTEFNAVFTLVFFVLTAYVLHTGWMSDFQLLAKKAISSAAYVTTEPVALLNFLSETIGQFYGVIFPMLLLLMVWVILTNVFQIGFIFTTFTMKPDFNKLNPAQNIKKIFAKKTLFELFKSILKITLFAAFIFLSADFVIDEVIAVIYTRPEFIADSWRRIFFQLVLWCLLLLGIIALLDYAYNKWDFGQKMMMSKRELKDEHKKREGDPEIKSKRKQAQKELLQKSAALSNVKNADIIVTNPTHIAIALQYDLHSMAAPKVLAMGKGELANKIRIQGRRFQVPIIQNKPVARKLYKECQLNQYLPLTCYDIVAPIFRWLFAIKEQSIHE